MLRENKNLKDNSQNSIKDNTSVSVPYKNTDDFFDSFPKLNKLITALYIVTDIIEKDEPIRLKLRTLGVEILSDINSTNSFSRTELNKKTLFILSLMDIASAINLISPMNFNILKKEFTELRQTLQVKEKSQNISHTWLEEFLGNSPLEGWPKAGVDKSIPPPPKGYSSRGESNSKNHNIQKKQRRDDIVDAIKASGGKATITEVKNKAKEALLNCSEKTLQRELISMVRDGILSKSGEKRWSKYYLP